jgi:hypothetical protein
MALGLQRTTAHAVAREYCARRALARAAPPVDLQASNLEDYGKPGNNASSTEAAKVGAMVQPLAQLALGSIDG